MCICSGTVGESPLAPATPPPSSFSLTCVSAGQFLSHVLTPLSQLLCSVFNPFLNTSARRHGQCHWWAQLWLAGSVRASSEWLCPAQDEPISLLKGATPAAPAAAQTWTPAHSAGWKLDKISYCPHWDSSLLKALLTSFPQMSLCCNDWHLLWTMYTLLLG